MHLPVAGCSGCTLGAPGDEAALEIILACARHSSGRREQQPFLSFDQGWSGRWVTHKLAASSLGSCGAAMDGRRHMLLGEDGETVSPVSVQHRAPEPLLST